MKTNFIFFVATLMAFMSCKKDSTGDNELNVLTTLRGENGLTYQESLRKWGELKNLNGNSYIYQTTFVSWTGSGSTTELRVENGIVVSRKYQEFLRDRANGQSQVVDSYTERADQVGTNNKGALPLTIDELYDTCAKNYLTADENNNTIYFETEKNGLMTLCGFVPNGCMDDCLFGVWVSAFEWI